MNDLRGTRWRRKSDGAVICIEGDSDSSGCGNRSLLAHNGSRSFWVTLEGLRRKYEAVGND